MEHIRQAVELAKARGGVTLADCDASKRSPNGSGYVPSWGQ
jgi:hypothetical protein